MKIRHFQGYGTVTATRLKDRDRGAWTLAIRVYGNHECGLRVHDIMDAYDWLVKKFDKHVPDFVTWERNAIDKRDRFCEKYNLPYEMQPIMKMISGMVGDTEVCDYYFNY